MRKRMNFSPWLTTGNKNFKAAINIMPNLKVFLKFWLIWMESQNGSMDKVKIAIEEPTHRK